MDILTDFDSLVADGVRPYEAAAGLLRSETALEILSEFDEGDRDALFGEESSGLILAVTVLQLDNQALQPETRELAFLAIKAERQAGATRFRTGLLNELEEKLKRS